jgi:hemerythrin superfamily protein
MSIYTVLKGEHSEVKALIVTIASMPDALDGGKEALFAKLRRELLSHARAEHETVYTKAAERVPRHMINDAEQEHEEIENLLNSLLISEVATDEWKIAFTALRERVEHHVHEEEEQVFPLMKAAFSDEEAKQLGKAFDDAKEAELTRLSELDKVARQDPS